MSVVGIDIGTELSKVAVAWRKKIHLVPNELTKPQTPTLIAFTSKERCFGDQATGQWNRNYKNTVSQIKRYLGRHSTDESLLQETAFWMKNSYGPLKDGRFGIDVETSQGPLRLAPEQILAGFLHKLKTFTSAFLEGTKINDCVIGCPAYFDDAQRRALLTAARLAEMNVLRVLNETTAIALNYGIVRQLPESETQRVMFVDVGSANTQVSIVDFIKGKLTMRYSTANPNCGGRDLDHVLFKHFQTQWMTKHKEDISNNPRACIRLQKEMRRIKKMLSGLRDAEWCIDCFSQDHDFLLKISRDEFEELSVEVLKSMQEPILEALQICENDNIPLHSVELVGAVRSVPCVQKSILSTVQTTVMGKTIEQISFTLNGDESVARGCALMCAMLSPNFRVREFQVASINTWPITISYPSEKNTEQIVDNTGTGGGTVEEDIDIKNNNSNVKIVEQLIIKRGDPSPCTAKVTFSKTSNFSFQLRQPNEFSNKNTKLSVKYPFLTNLNVGEFHIQMLPLSENAVSEPKVKLMLSLNRHGVIDWPQASLIEWVKREPEPEPEPEPKPEPKSEPKSETKPETVESKAEEAVKDKETNEDTQMNDRATEEMNNDNGNNNKMDVDAKPDTEVNNNCVDNNTNNNKPSSVDTNESTTTDDIPNTTTTTTNDETVDAVPNVPKPKKKKKQKKKITRNLVVSGTFANELSNSVFNEWNEIEANMVNVDRIIAETYEAKNDLEAYIYDIRSQVNGELSEFIKKSDSQSFLKQLEAMEDWLYEDGVHANKTQYFDKLATMKTIGDPIGSRWWESQQLPNRVSQFKKLLSRYMTFVESTDDKYAHIENEQKDNVRKFVTKADEWIGNKLIAQDRLQKYDPPAVRCSEIDQKYRELHKKCEHILNTPKPKPKPKKEKKDENIKETNDENIKETNDENTAETTDANETGNNNTSATKDENVNSAVDVNGDTNMESSKEAIANTVENIESTENTNDNNSDNNDNNDGTEISQFMEVE